VRRLLPCVLALVALFALPGVADARYYTLGSDLKADANVVEHHGADSAFWNIKLGSGGLTHAPEGGQVVEVKLKGMALPDPRGIKIPTTMIHFQTLHPFPDNSTLVELSSAAFYTPLGGNPNTVTTYRPVNMCLHKGDILDFNNNGGNQWFWGEYDGIPYQMFARVPGSATNWFMDDQGTNIGTRWKPRMTKDGLELLMQMKFATGPDATSICPGGYKQHIFPGLDLRDGQTANLKTEERQAKARVTCPGKTFGSCRGVVRATMMVNGREILLGQDHFKVPKWQGGSIYFDLTKKQVRRIQRMGKAKVTLTADSYDDPDGDQETYKWRALHRDASDQVPIQRKTTTATVTFKPDKKLAKKKRRRG
jgi:hypothetical protein